MGAGARALLSQCIRPGMVVVDVGANQGLYTLLFSQLIGEQGRVYAFEPDPELYECAEQNCLRNRAQNVEVYRFALGSTDTSLTLSRSLVNAGDNRLGLRRQSAAERSIDVPVRRFDSVITHGQIDFIKIDVQGWELHVLRGMERLLGSGRSMTIYLEFWPAGLRGAGTDPLDLLTHLRHRGFSIHQLRGTEMHAVADDAHFVRSIRRRAYTNLLATR